MPSSLSLSLWVNQVSMTSLKLQSQIRHIPLAKGSKMYAMGIQNLYPEATIEAWHDVIKRMETCGNGVEV